MKILLIGIGTRGDVQPFITLGKALNTAGYDVTLAASKQFEVPIAEAGIAHHKLELDFQDLMEQPEIREALTGIRGKLKAYQFSKDMLHEQYSDLWALGERLQPDLILHHFKAPLSPYIARRFKGTSIPIMLQPGFMETWDYPQFLIASRSLGGWGNRLSHKLIKAVMSFGTNMLRKGWEKSSGIDIGPAMPPMDGYSHAGNQQRIHAYSPSIVARPSTWEASEVTTGYFLDDQVTDYQPDPALADFLQAGDPPVYFGFGSMPGMDPDRINAAVTGAINNLGIRAIIATGWGGLDHIQALPNVHIIKSAPHSWLFPQMAAVVHHGGSGTTHEGLRWGRPTVICPLFADQPFFGERVADLGAGPRPVAQKKLTAQNLTQAIEVALKPETAQRAEQIGQSIRGEQGVQNALDVVAEIAKAQNAPAADA